MTRCAWGVGAWEPTTALQHNQYNNTKGGLISKCILRSEGQKAATIGGLVSKCILRSEGKRVVKR